MFKKIGGSPSPSIQTPRTTASSNPAPSAAPRAAPSAPSAAPQGNDGFTTRARPSAGSHVPTTSSSRGLALPPGKDVSQDFANNPSQFMSNNTLNAYNSTNNFKGSKQNNPEGVPMPPPGNPANPQELRLNNAFVPARDSRVTMHVNQQPGGNANMSFSPAGGTGVQAHYMPYVSQGEGTFGGVNRIPMHPQVGDPKMVVTGPLNGCAVHAFHDNSNNTMAFVHQANFSQAGDANLNKFKAANPHLQHLESIKPQDYSQPIKNGKPLDETGATAFAHYEQRPGQAQGQWKLSGQINELNGQFQHMNDPKVARQELKRPDLKPIMVPDAQGIEQPTPRPMHIQKPLDPANPLQAT